MVGASDPSVLGPTISEDELESDAISFAIIDITGAIFPCGLALASIPTGWLLCDGAAVSRTTYAALFTAIGTRFGIGDGSTTFNLPDFRGGFPRGAPAATECGSTGGEDTHALSTSELASHTHAVTNPTHGHQTGTTVTGTRMHEVQATVWTVGQRGITYQYGVAIAQATSIDSAGSGNAHENRPVFQEVQWIIKT